MSIAYLDPGNIESDLQSGSVAKYKVGKIWWSYESRPLPLYMWLLIDVQLSNTTVNYSRKLMLKFQHLNIIHIL